MANETTSTPVAAPTIPAATTAPATTEAHATTGAHGVTYNPKMPEPQIINGVKVYPTSYIPARAELHYPKKMLVEMKEWHIEAVHIVIFFIVLIGLYITQWKRPDHR